MMIQGCFLYFYFACLQSCYLNLLNAGVAGVNLFLQLGIGSPCEVSAVVTLADRRQTLC